MATYTYNDLLNLFASKLTGGVNSQAYVDLVNVLNNSPLLRTELTDDGQQGILAGFVPIAPGGNEGGDFDPKTSAIGLPVDASGLVGNPADIVFVIGHEDAHAEFSNTVATEETNFANNVKTQLQAGGTVNFDDLIALDQGTHALDEARAEIGGWNAYVSYEMTTNSTVTGQMLFSGTADASLFISAGGAHLANGPNFDPTTFKVDMNDSTSIFALEQSFFYDPTLVGGIFLNQNYSNLYGGFEIGSIMQYATTTHFSGTIQINFAADHLDPMLVAEGMSQYAGYANISFKVLDPSNGESYTYSTDVTGAETLFTSSDNPNATTIFVGRADGKYTGLSNGQPLNASSVSINHAVAFVAPGYYTDVTANNAIINLSAKSSAGNIGGVNVYNCTVGGKTSSATVNGSTYLSCSANATNSPLLTIQNANIYGTVNSGTVVLAQGGDDLVMANNSAVILNAGVTATLTCGSSVPTMITGDPNGSTAACSVTGELNVKTNGATINSTGATQGSIQGNNNDITIGSTDGSGPTITGSQDVVHLQADASGTVTGTGEQVKTANGFDVQFTGTADVTSGANATDIEITNGQGQASRSILDYNDGITEELTYDTTGTQSWTTRDDVYSGSGLIQQNYYYRDGTQSVEVFDPNAVAEGESIASYQNWFDSSGNIAKQAVDNVDGTSTISTFDPTDDSSRIDAYRADGSLAEQTVDNSDGTHSVEYYAPASGTQWTTDTFGFLSDGDLSNEIIRNDDGSTIDTYFLYSTAGVGALAAYYADSSSMTFALYGDPPAGDEAAIGYGGSGIINFKPFPDGEALYDDDIWTGSPTGGEGDATVDILGFNSDDPYSDADPFYFMPADSIDSEDLGYLIYYDYDPLVLNLGSGAVSTKSIGQSGISFDMRGTGGVEPTGWITTGEGFLVVNKTSTSQIHSVDDLVASLVQLSDYDSNGDGKITAADAMYSKIAVWTPGTNGSGGTVRTLAQLGITRINLSATSVDQFNNNNYISSSFTFAYNDGTTGQGADVTFQIGENQGGQATGAATQSSQISTLQSAKGTAGNDTLIAGAGVANLIGNGGNDTYDIVAPTAVTIVNGVARTDDPSGTLSFGAGVAAGQLRFLQSGSDLVVDVIGSTKAVTIKGWFASDYAELNSIVSTADGTSIGYTDGNNYLHGAMAVNGIGISASANYYLSGDTSVVTNYFEAASSQYNPANFQWEHDVVDSDGSSHDTILGSHVSNILSADTLIAASDHDTLFGGTGMTTLVGNLSSDTLVAGSGGAIADYTQSNIAISLTNSSNAVSGSLSDHLVGITAAMVSGNHDTLTAGSNWETLVANGTGDTVSGGGAGAGAVLIATGANDTLVGGSVVTTLFGAGGGDILIGGSAATTLIGDGGGETLIGGAGAEVAVLQVNGSADNIFINLSTGLARKMGAGVNDTLIGVSQAAAYGANDWLTGGSTGWTNLYAFGTSDTLVGGSGGVTNMRGHANGSTLVAGANGVSVAQYNDDGAVVNLSTGVASEAGSSHANDTLVGITVATIAGDGSVLVGGPNTDTLTATGDDDTLIATSGSDTLIATGSGDTLVGFSSSVLIGVAGDTTAFYRADNQRGDLSTMTGITRAVATGAHDTLIGTNVAATLFATGGNDTLIGGSAATTILIGDGGGETLIGGAGAEVAVLQVNGSADNIFINLSTGLARKMGGTNDTLIGITQAAAYGANDWLTGGSTGTTNLYAFGTSDTLVGGSGGVTNMRGHANGSTLVAGANGVSVAQYNDDGAVVNLSTGVASEAGSSHANDALFGFTVGAITGDNATLTGAAGANTLTATGANDTIFNVGGGSTLIASGASDEFVYGGNSSVTIAGAGDTKIDITSAGSVVSLSGAHVTGVSTAIADNSNIVLTGASTGWSYLQALGGSDTLIGGAGRTNLYGHANGSTLVGGTGTTSAVYNDDGAVVRLGPGTATEGTNPTDTLIGITVAAIGGDGSYLYAAGGAADILTASGTDDTLVASSGAATLVATGSGDALFAGGGYSQLRSHAQGNTLVASTVSGSTSEAYYGDDGAVVNLSTGVASEAGSGHANDTLVGFNVGTIAGDNATLIGAAGANTLTASGSADTLVGSTVTNTLIGSSSGDTTAYAASSGQTVNLWAASEVTIAIAAGANDKLYGTTRNADTVTLTATGAADTLVGGSGAVSQLYAYGSGDILMGGSAGTSYVRAFGSGDTLIGGAGRANLYGHATGSTLIDGAGITAAVYNDDGAVVNLSTGVASEAGSGHANDTLVGFTVGTIGGDNATLTGAAGANTLTATGANDTIFNVGGGSTLIASGTSDEIVYGGNPSVTIAGAGDTKIDITSAGSVVSLSGANVAGVSSAIADNSNIVLSGLSSGSSTLTATGSGDTLIAVGGSSQLFGDAGASLVATGGTAHMSSQLDGETLIQNGGTAVAGYSVANATINLSTGKATAAGYTDTLIGVAQAQVWGSNDKVIAGGATSILYAFGSDETLIAGSGYTQLRSHATGDTLVASTVSGSTSEAYYGDDGAVVNLSTGVASEAGSGHANDTLLNGFIVGTITGDNATLTGAAGANTLTATGASDTIFNVGGGSTLIAGGTSDEIVYGGSSSVTIAGAGDTKIDITSTGSVVSLSGAHVTGVSNAIADNSNIVLTGGSTGLSYLQALGGSDTLIGGSGSARLYGHGNGSTLIGGTGTTSVVYNDDGVSVRLGSGTAIEGTSPADTLIGITAAAIGGDGSYLYAAGGAADTLTASGTDDTLVASSGASTLSATGSGDALYAGGGASTLSATGGGSFYEVPSTAGSTTIINGASGNTTATNEIDFAGTNDEALWFVHSGNDLVIDQLGTTKSVTVKGWFANTSSQVDTITAGGLSLDTRVNQLVQAMATYQSAHSAFDPTTATTMPTDTALQNAIAASWHS